MWESSYRLISIAFVAFLCGLFLGRWTVNPEIHQPTSQQGKQIILSKDQRVSEVLQATRRPIAEEDLQVIRPPIAENEQQSDDRIRVLPDGLAPQLSPMDEARFREGVKADMELTLTRQGVPKQDIENFIEGRQAKQEDPPLVVPSKDGLLGNR